MLNYPEQDNRHLNESITDMSHEGDAELIQNLMKAVRDKRSERVFELQTEAHRLVDWKEYVRTAPIASLIGSAAAGFLVVNGLQRSPPAARALPVQSPSTQSNAATNAATKARLPWLVSLAMPIVTNAAKKYIAQSLSSLLQGSSNESKSAAPTNQERRSYAE